MALGCACCNPNDLVVHCAQACLRICYCNRISIVTRYFTRFFGFHFAYLSNMQHVACC